MALLAMMSSWSFGQLCKVNGTVQDALTGEALIGAYVKAGGAVVATDIEGRFSIAIPKGDEILEVSYIGYSNNSKEVSCLGAETNVVFRMETLIMKEAVVSADVVISRKTPVAFTNVLPAQIQEELAGRGCLCFEYHAWCLRHPAGGGDGDARVTIRLRSNEPGSHGGWCG